MDQSSLSESRMCFSEVIVKVNRVPKMLSGLVQRFVILELDEVPPSQILLIGLHVAGRATTSHPVAH